MTDQTSPTEKVQELATKYSGDVPTDPHFLLGEIKADLRALLPTPPQPTTGLLGRWAKHEEYGDVVCMWDRPDLEGNMHVRWVDESFPVATGRYYVPLSSLTFPDQTTRPEDVPAGEAWLVNLNRGVITRVVALKVDRDAWKISDRSDSVVDLWSEEFVELICPLTPERPESDLQAKYDALEDKHRKAVEKIKTLEQALDNLRAVGGTWRVCDAHPEESKPVWRIEHDWQNLRAGEYIIDKDGDTVVAETKHWMGELWYTDDLAFVAPERAPYIVFRNKYVATPEAIKEAKQARGKETEK